MKKLFSLIATIALLSSVFSQSPEKMSYQAVIRNSSNNLVTNFLVGMKISILQGTAEGTVVYMETQSPETNANGLVSIEIGTGSTSDDFSAIDWTNGPYYLKTETDPAGGANYTIVGASQLLSVPYALYSETAGNVFSGNYNDLANQPLLFDGTWASLLSKPTFATVATSGSYNDLTDQPALFSGSYNDLTDTPTLFNGTWENITGKPTTLAGYGITDGMNTSHVANGITSSLISNWNTAFSWGDHDGLYRPIGYVPAWNEITGRPTFAAVATSGSYTDLINTPTIEGSQWTTSGNNIYYNTGNVGVGTGSPATYLHAHGSPVSNRGQLSLSAPSGEGIFLSLYDADIYKAYLWYNVGDEDLHLQNVTDGDLILNYFGGNVGVGTNAPEFRLTLDNDGGIIAKGVRFNGKILEASGQGTRLIWYPRKAAFRAGFILGNQWDDANIGNYSAAFGFCTIASGTYSTAMGDYNEATGMASTAMGGGTNAIGNYSTSMGGHTEVESYACLGIGRYNFVSSSYTPDSWVATDPVFIIGNGTSSASRHNAVLVRKDGAVYFPDVYGDALITIFPYRDLYISSTGQIGYLASSLRYKKNISSMEDVSWLYQLRPVNFVYNSDNSETKQYGLIAEEVEDVNPLFVSYNEKGEVETVSYSQLVSPMIKALQEQQQLIKELKARIEVLENN